MMRLTRLLRPAIVLTTELLLLIAVCPTQGDAVTASHSASWRIEHYPAPDHAGLVGLSSVACASTSRCDVVSGYTAPDGHVRPLALDRRHGSWHLAHVSLPSSATTGDYAAAELNGVSCATTSTCIGVGDFVRDVPHTSSPHPVQDHALVESWNGSRWHPVAVPTPHPSSSTDYQTSSLLGVSCVTRTSCVAVGYHTSGERSQEALAARWNGHAWHVAYPPSRGASGHDSTRLTQVSCAAKGRCLAVGYFETPDGEMNPVVDRLTSNGWRAVGLRLPSDLAPDGDAVLGGVGCWTSTSCLAAGYYDSTDETARVLAYQLSHGQLVARPEASPRGTSGTKMASVSCRSGKGCTIFGVTYAQPDEESPHAAEAGFAKQHWSAVHVLSSPFQDGVLASACPSPTRCTVLADSRGSGSAIIRHD